MLAGMVLFLDIPGLYGRTQKNQPVLFGRSPVQYMASTLVPHEFDGIFSPTIRHKTSIRCLKNTQ
jgi:hypothetical protein